MQFNHFIAAAILAYTATAMPTAPSVTSVAAQAPATSSAAPTSTGLSVTQQLFIADTAADRFKILSDDAMFKFDFAAKEAELIKAAAEANPPKKHNGDVVAANRKTFPALVGTGAGMAVGFLNGCAFNTPHVHPRSVELQIVTKGRLTVEMIPENGVLNADGTRRVIKNDVGVNQMTPFYQGSVHTQFNPDCEPAEFVAAFNSEDFGAGQVADELFAFDDHVVLAAVGGKDSVFGAAIEASELEKFRKSIPVSIAVGVQQCIDKCKYYKKPTM
jgi:hypothetical protein